MASAIDLLNFHRFCLTDPATEVFQKAISASVEPGDLVVDIGAGTGILSFFACEAGARHVYAVEADESIELAKVLALANGFGDRITFIKSLSYQLELSEKADVVISNTLECFGVEGGLVGTMIDARERFLKHDGLMIPQGLGLYLAPIEFEQKYLSSVDIWNERLFGYDFSNIRTYSVNNRYGVKIQRDQFLASPKLLSNMQFNLLDSVVFHGRMDFKIIRNGTLHGLCGWFSTKLTSNEILSNEPEVGNTHYNQAFFPLKQAIEISPGDEISVSISIRMPNLWRWRVSVARQGITKLTEAESSFDHSTFWGFPISREEIQSLSSIAMPHLSSMGAAELLVLQSMNGEMTIGDLEEILKFHYPQLFRSDNEIGTFVRKIVSRCS